MKRRRFLALSGGAVSGIWIAGSGFLQLERDTIWKLGGFCSFCDRAAGDVFGLAGIAERSVGICDECSVVCLRLAGAEKITLNTPDDWTAPDDFDALIVASAPDFESSRAIIEKALRAAGDFRRETSTCSFCDKDEKDVAKLVAGRGVHICNGCVGETAAILLRRKMQA